MDKKPEDALPGTGQPGGQAGIGMGRQTAGQDFEAPVRPGPSHPDHQPLLCAGTAQPAGAPGPGKEPGMPEAGPDDGQPPGPDEYHPQAERSGSKDQESGGEKECVKGSEECRGKSEEIVGARRLFGLPVKSDRNVRLR